MMDWIYTAISWILLRWHDLWDWALPGSGMFLATNWNWVLAIVFLVITVRVVLFPIFVKQIRSQRAMQALQPKMKELQQKYKGDQQTLREEMMKLYQTEKVNPLMGCLPLLLQIPVFFGLFHVLSYINPGETNKTQYGWTAEQFDGAAGSALFTAPIPARFADGAEQLAALGAHGVGVKLVAGVLVLIMMLTTFMTSRQMILKTGWSQEPQQRMIQKLMLYGIPVSLLLSGWYFPIGVVIYWVVQNIFSLGQQYWVLHKYPPPVTENNIPPKSASARAREAAATKEPGFLARFFKVLPPAPKPAAGFVGNAQDQTRSGLFRRRTAAAPPPPPEPRSLAPRPGAKPKTTPPSTSGTSTDSGSTGADAAPKSGATAGSAGKAAATGSTAKASPAKGTPTKGTPAKTPGAKATPPPAKITPSKSAAPGASTSGSSANGSGASSAPAGATPNGAAGAAAGGTTAGGNAAGGGTASGAAGRPRSTTKKASPPRKGNPNRKGGAKR
jgi:YidC/Oxa1 family membrane protein insertase